MTFKLCHKSVNHQCRLFAPKLKDKFIGVARKVPIEHHQATSDHFLRQSKPHSVPRSSETQLMTVNVTLGIIPERKVQH